MPVIGFLHTRAPDVVAELLRGFRRGLREAGFVEGETVAIEYRWAEIRTIGYRPWRPIWSAAGLR